MKKPTNQVRIIGGKHKRRQLSFIDTDGLRPTPDRLRETVFNWLMADTLDARVLDMCAGSGVLGFEALSRGARHATFIEPNKAQAVALRHNADSLRLTFDEYTIINTTAQTALPTLSAPFDIIFVDPPYTLNLWQSLITLATSQGLIHTHTKIYLESDRPLDEIAHGLTAIKHTKVGQVYAGIFNQI
ncbi:MAG: 16S rRNA (guanine(966)-N(2))-methyltransferase RsmD [Moraxella sp.]|nr:16S rRNA (guanine(966)-N(2))-methyltransferase RsmD [Moraxella sp.]